MPYLEFLFCEKCGNSSSLDIDYLKTVESYIKDGKKEPFVNQATLLWEYLIYYCPRCGKTYRYTYRDVEERVRDYLAAVSERFRIYFEEKGLEVNTENVKVVAGEVGLVPVVNKNTMERVQNFYASKKA